MGRTWVQLSSSYKMGSENITSLVAGIHQGCQMQAMQGDSDFTKQKGDH